VGSSQKYTYVPLERNTPLGGTRHYICPRTSKRLPSVTSIIDQTSDKTGLLEWRKRIGDKKADEIKNEALGLGTLMHSHLECFLAGKPRPTGNNLVRLQAEAMADQIIEHGLSQIDEIYGSEVGLYYPGLYAGTMDGIGLYHDKLCVFDFKTARKMKKLEHIEDYLIQLCAYSAAHDELFGTEITTGIIFMVDRDFQYQTFILEGGEFKAKALAWVDRLDRYFATPVSSLG
jgi:CRISPR/Cas system-associated exonuclease Cas4 (RecB family)